MKRWVAATGLLGMLLLSACALLPQEEEPLPPPLLRVYEEQKPAVVVVERGDLLMEKMVSCNVRALQGEQYSMMLLEEDEDLIQLHVQIGDVVEPGDMLSEWGRKDMAKALEKLEDELHRQQLLAVQAKDSTTIDREQSLLKYYREQLSLLPNSAEFAEREALLAQITAQEKRVSQLLEDYLLTVQLAENEIEKTKLKYAALKAEADKQASYTNIGGTVTNIKFVRDRDPANLPFRVIVLITVDDMTAYTYYCNSNTELFTIGEVYPMKVNGETYWLRAESLNTTGTPEIVFEAEANGVLPIDKGIKENGTIRLQVEHRENVLLLPASVVKYAGNQAIVYILDENGLRTVKTVEPGLKVGGKLEILSGVVEGEEILAR